MDTNPFDSWYEAQLTSEDDIGYISDKCTTTYVPEKWTYRVIECNKGQNAAIKAKKLDLAEVDEWVFRRSPKKSPGFDILITQHKVDGVRHRPHLCIPFEANHFKRMVKALSLPSQYFHLRTTASVNCNSFMRRVYRDEDGIVSKTSCMMRTGHGSSQAASSVWSAAMRWDASSGRTTAIIEGLFNEDLDELTFLVNACSQFLGHPLMFPEILLHMTTVRLNEYLRIPCEEAFYVWEQRTGLSNLPYFNLNSHVAVWNWTLEDFQHATTIANRSLTNMAFLRRRFQYTTQCAEKLLTMLAELKDSEYENKNIAMLFGKEDEWRQRLSDRILQSQTYEHQTDCVQKRIENLNNVLYTVLSQINSKNQGELAKINLQIAQAVRSDSIPMRTIAYVTLIFLPGALVASMFGMNFFEFESASKTVVVGNTFWVYWAITIPFTVLVVTVWNVWNLFEKRKELLINKGIYSLPQGQSSQINDSNARDGGWRINPSQTQV